MRSAKWLAAACLLAGCVVEDPAPPRVEIRVAVADSFDGLTGWSVERRRLLEDYIPMLSGPAGTGNTWVVVARPDQADVTVRSYISTTDAVERYQQGNEYIEVDYGRLPESSRLQRAAGHGLMHWLTDRVGRVPHICRSAERDPTCYPGITGEALLNISFPEEGVDYEEFIGPVDPLPTGADRRLLTALGVP